MGISANQARFLSLTARQCDLEHRVQQICQRRLRLSSELERIATDYNNHIGNRKMFTPSLAGLNNLSIQNLAALGYTVLNPNTPHWYQPISEQTAVNQGYDEAHIIRNAAEFVSKMAYGANGNFILVGDIDMSGITIPAFSFSEFDGNGHVISNLNLSNNQRGLFEVVFGSVKNLEIKDAQSNYTGVDNAGILAGQIESGATIENVHITGSSSISGGSFTGGLAGWNNGGHIIGCDSSASVNDFINGGGGLVGLNDHVIENSYATGSVSAGQGFITGGLVGYNTNAGAIVNSYSTGDVSSDNVAGFVGGFVGMNNGNNISTSYTTGNVYGAGTLGGFSAENMGIIDSENFYKNNMNSTAANDNSVNANVNPMPLGSWDPTIWDTSNGLPQLIKPEFTITKIVTINEPPEDLEQKIRSGEYCLAREADLYTQSPIQVGGSDYETLDWRTVPEVYDELYRADDMDAENKYDRVVSQINSQDKKLQLEQSSVEVEYKAIVSEKEAVKKILDTNAGNSFKYFS